MTRGSCRANQQHQLERNNRIETPTPALDVQLRNRGAPCGYSRGFLGHRMFSYETAVHHVGILGVFGVNSVKKFFQLRTLLKGS